MDKFPVYLTEKNLGNIFKTLLPKMEFIHNKTVPNSNLKNRPDYRFENLKLIIEFDGYQHYQNADVIIRDKKKDSIYSSMGYRVFRIPYFIQMTNELIKELFNQEANYLQIYPHGFIDEAALLPANFCELGIQKFVSDLNRFDSYRGEIINSLKQKIFDKKEINLVLPPSLHYLVE